MAGRAAAAPRRPARKGEDGDEDKSDAPFDVVMRFTPSEITPIIAAQFARLKSERAQLEADMQNFQDVKKKVAEVHFPTYISLDIGGVRFKTAVKTLQREPGSVLAAMFSGTGFALETDDTGAYFIDRDGTHFRHILNFLRGALDTKTLADQERKELLIEAKFYTLTRLIDVLDPPRLTLAHDRPGQGRGLFYWLGTKRATTETYASPVATGDLAVTTRDGDQNAQQLEDLVGVRYFLTGRASAKSGWCNSAITNGQWFVVELKTVSFVPTHYSLRWSETSGCHQLNNWLLEGSVDGTTFALLDRHVGAQSQTVNVLPVATPPADPIRFVRVTCTGHDAASVSCFCFHVAGLELYGEVYI